ncbi:ArsR/SmtB family transcription factor [Paenibacillus lautus]|uniref:ArsR/SmtB family transcription factor n=1 Tax=Paenibacillus lautus TaxID=1401 RepID=UPI003D2DA4E9
MPIKTLLKTPFHISNAEKPSNLIWILLQEGVGLSQSTVSDYLATLQRVGLVEVRRIGQWTYYKRNEATISALAEIIGN